MQSDKIIAALTATGIPVEDEKAVPCNGITKPLPYMVIRQTFTDVGDDAGRIRIQKIEWTVALFTKNKELELDRKIRSALSPVGRLDVTPCPDGTPYETNYEFKTIEISKGGN